MLEKITSMEKEMIKHYISSYADVANHPNPRAEVDTVLAPWAAAKSEYLSTIFKDNLIIQSPVEFLEDEFEIEEKITKNLLSLPKIHKVIKQILDSFDNWSDRSVIHHIINSKTLRENKVNLKKAYFHTPYELTLPNGEVLKIQEGAKPIRLIKKIFQAFKVEDLLIEELRNLHSQCLNTKKISGNLCLSIHPLDYMTMSDNDSGWDSCMSWANGGEYRQGTVEMMNSPCVIVAYLTAKEDMYMPGDYRWNNKKWRCLFIVDNECAISVRQYPYYNDNLVKEVLNKIAELSNWNNSEPFHYDYKEHRREPLIQNNRQVQIETSTNWMYNDFGADKHQMIINPRITEDFIRSIEYSGVSECMWCGDTGDINESEALTCSMCGEHTRCECCGTSLWSEEIHWLGDSPYCYDCYDELTDLDELAQEDDYNQFIHPIYLSTSNKGLELNDSKALIYSIQTNPDGYGFRDHFKGEVKEGAIILNKSLGIEQIVYYVTPNQIINPNHLFNYHMNMSEADQKYYTKLAKQT